MATLAAVAVTMFACEIVIGDPPRDSSSPQSQGGSGMGAAPSGGLTNVGGSAPSEGTGALGGSPAQGEGDACEEGGSSGAGSLMGGGGATEVAAPSAGGGAGGAPSASAGEAPDAVGGAAGASGSSGALPCAPVTWYRDDDGDGYGSDASIFACPPPAGHWVLVSGDCDDTREEVHPEQQKFFGVPYQKADATDSFDYDCSGEEEPNPTLALAPEDCGLLKLALCGDKSGYETNDRSGPGINEYCGSTVVRVCTPKVLACETTERFERPPFTCR